MKRGLDVRVDAATDREIAAGIDLSRYDFALPSAGAALNVARDRHTVSAGVPFFTTIAFATFTDVADALEKAGVARHDGGRWTLDVKRYMALVEQKPRWSDLPENTTYRSGAPMSIAAGDLGRSSAAGLYAAVAGYVANHDRVLDSFGAVDGVINAVSPLLVHQGGADRSWDAPFEDYVSMGSATAPIALVDESQFVARSLADNGSIRPNMVLMYPAPGVLSRYGFVALTPGSDPVRGVLADDPVLARLAVAHGFRVAAPANATKNDKIAGRLTNVVDVPSYDILASLVAKLDIAQHLASSSANLHRSGRP